MTQKTLRKTIYLSKSGMRILNSQAIKHTRGNVSEYLDRILKNIKYNEKLTKPVTHKKIQVPRQ